MSVGNRKSVNELSPLFVVLTVIFCTCLIASNLLETKIVQIGLYTFTGGTLCFPVSYILNDCITEVWGFSRARMVIWLGFVADLMVVLLGQLTVWLPAAEYWQENEVHFNYVFGLAPRIAFASFCAFLIGSLLNSYVMSRMKRVSGERHFSIRAILSTLVGEGADSMIFFPLAFGGLMPLPDMGKLIMLQVATKTLYEIFVLPVTIRFVQYVKKKEFYSNSNPKP